MLRLLQAAATPNADAQTKKGRRYERTSHRVHAYGPGLQTTACMDRGPEPQVAEESRSRRSSANTHIRPARAEAGRTDGRAGAGLLSVPHVRYPVRQEGRNAPHCGP